MIHYLLTGDTGAALFSLERVRELTAAAGGTSDDAEGCGALALATASPRVVLLHGGTTESAGVGSGIAVIVFSGKHRNCSGVYLVHAHTKASLIRTSKIQAQFPTWHLQPGYL